MEKHRHLWADARTCVKNAGQRFATDSERPRSFRDGQIQGLQAECFWATAESAPPWTPNPRAPIELRVSPACFVAVPPTDRRLVHQSVSGVSVNLISTHPPDGASSRTSRCARLEAIQHAEKIPAVNARTGG